jgi:succinate-semialdehyde dehydrogenase/glutarate-semialdehyde dehydrogenase
MLQHVVVEALRRPFEEAFVTHMRQARVGDPLDERTQVGRLARHDLRADLHHQVQVSLAKGATCLLGGVLPEGKGAYYPPTVLTQVTKGMPAYDDELFGPVAAIIADFRGAESTHIPHCQPHRFQGMRMFCVR